MRLYVDPFTQDELLSDAYPCTEDAEMGTLDFTGKKIMKQADDEDPDNKIEVIDIVDNFNLQPLPLKKASFMGWAKQYFPKRKAQLEASAPSKVADFMAKSKKLLQFIGTKFDEFDFYMGQSCDPDAMLVFSYYKDGVEPHFIIFKDGVDDEKC